MLGSISGQQLAEWTAYAQVEPFGEERADLRMGILAALIANVNRDPKQGRTYKPEDFMPTFGQGSGPQNEAEKRAEVAGKVEAYFMALAAAGQG